MRYLKRNESGDISPFPRTGGEAERKSMEQMIRAEGSSGDVHGDVMHHRTVDLPTPLSSITEIRQGHGLVWEDIGEILKAVREIIGQHRVNSAAWSLMRVAS